MHVRHRDDRGDADLEAALRAAEASVKEKLGYTIALTEKPLFDPNGAMEAADSAAITATGDEEVVDSDEEDLLEPEERGRRMYARGDGPPSPHPENRAVLRGYSGAAAAAAAATGASSSVQDPAPACGNKRSHLEIDDDDPDLNDPGLNAAMAEADQRLP